MKLDELKEEGMFVLVAPDGTPQLSTLAPNYAMCIGFCELLGANKIMHPLSELLKEGFEILMVKVSMSQLGDAKTAFLAAKRNSAKQKGE